MHLDEFHFICKQDQCARVRYPGSWPLRWNRGQWCRHRTRPRGAVPGLCHNRETPLPFLTGTVQIRKKCWQDFVGWEWFRQMLVYLLTNLWWLEGALLQLFLQLCQRCVSDQLLKHKSLMKNLSEPLVCLVLWPVTPLEQRFCCFWGSLLKKAQPVSASKKGWVYTLFIIDYINSQSDNLASDHLPKISLTPKRMMPLVFYSTEGDHLP